MTGGPLGNAASIATDLNRPETDENRVATQWSDFQVITLDAGRTTDDDAQGSAPGDPRQR